MLLYNAAVVNGKQARDQTNDEGSLHRPVCIRNLAKAEPRDGHLCNDRGLFRWDQCISIDPN